MSDGTLGRHPYVTIGFVLLAAVIAGALVLTIAQREQSGSSPAPGTAATAQSPVQDLGPEQDFPAGTLRYFRDLGLYLVRQADGSFLALYDLDPRQQVEKSGGGCRVRWEGGGDPAPAALPLDGRFRDPCLGSTFGTDGELLSGPASRGLDRYPVALQGDHVYVDLSRLLPGPEPGATSSR